MKISPVVKPGFLCKNSLSFGLNCVMLIMKYQIFEDYLWKVGCKRKLILALWHV